MKNTFFSPSEANTTGLRYLKVENLSEVLLQPWFLQNHIKIVLLKERRTTILAINIQLDSTTNLREKIKYTKLLPGRKKHFFNVAM